MTRSAVLLVAAVLVLVTSAATMSSSPAATTRGGDFTLVLRERLGPYRYWRTLKQGGAYAQAVAAFGPPDAAGKSAPDSNLCIVRWERLGLDVGFAGAVFECTPKYLEGAAWYGMRLWGPHWRTARGLRVGDPIGEIRRRYPRARYISEPPFPSEWHLITVIDDPDIGRHPLLVAEIGAGRVIALNVPAGYIF